MTKTKDQSKYVSNNESILGNTPDKDGVTHINIYSRGMTRLGIMLSHFHHAPFTHPYFGPFYSMEGLWYFARNGFDEKSAGRLRYLSGYRAKKVGKEFPMMKYDEFSQDIVAANYQKIIQNEEIRKLMIESDLPFDHYYTFGVLGQVITPRESDWLIEGFEDIRTALKEGVVPSVWLEAEKRYLGRK